SAYGSHYYAAPEQASDFRNTPEQADIFALGCILHDYVDPSPIRVPFSQIRVGGTYGPILEKCTESEPKRRFPTISALRSALFDLWRTTQFEAPVADDADLLQSVLDSPQSIEAWRRLIGHAETISTSHRGSILRSINADLLIQLNSVDE